MIRRLRHRIRCGGPEVSVRVIRTASRRRTIALQISPNGRLTLRAPLGTPPSKLAEVLRAKAPWLERRFPGIPGMIAPPSRPREFVAGETFHYLGRQRRLKLRRGALEDKVWLDGEFLHVDSRGTNRPQRAVIRARLKAWYVAQAKEILPGRVARWTSAFAIRPVPRVFIADQSRRWASCSKGKVLRFNWRLIGAPASLVDYVIIHELCHLNWPDHSTRFWRQISRVMPDYLVRMHQLEQLGPSYVF